MYLRVCVFIFDMGSLESITCPSVVLFAGDGMWKQAKFIKTRLFTIPWALTVATAHVRLCVCACMRERFSLSTR